MTKKPVLKKKISWVNQTDTIIMYSNVHVIKSTRITKFVKIIGTREDGIGRP